jgi:hypothetical protein
MRTTLSLFVLILFVSCTVSKPNCDVYKTALDDAKNIHQKKVVHTLTAVTPQNKDIIFITPDSVLALTWQDKHSYETFYNEGKPGMVKSSPFPDKPVFVTIAPELKKWYDANKPDSFMLDSRLEQLMGMPPNSKKTYLVELHIAVKDLFRLCKDSSILDKGCEVEFPAGTDETYKGIWNNYYNSAHSHKTLYENWPFQGLGYTYDWNYCNKTHVGLSEFCIRPGVYMYTSGGKPTREYLEHPITSK